MHSIVMGITCSCRNHGIIVDVVVKVRTYANDNDDEDNNDDDNEDDEDGVVEMIMMVSDV